MCFLRKAFRLIKILWFFDMSYLKKLWIFSTESWLNLTWDNFLYFQRFSKKKIEKTANKWWFIGNISKLTWHLGYKEIMTNTITISAVYRNQFKIIFCLQWFIIAHRVYVYKIILFHIHFKRPTNKNNLPEVGWMSGIFTLN